MYKSPFSVLRRRRPGASPASTAFVRVCVLRAQWAAKGPRENLDKIFISIPPVTFVSNVFIYRRFILSVRATSSSFQKYRQQVAFRMIENQNAKMETLQKNWMIALFPTAQEENSATKNVWRLGENALFSLSLSLSFSLYTLLSSLTHRFFSVRDILSLLKLFDAFGLDPKPAAAERERATPFFL